eukprot:1090113-Rhodomonas_salina.5
MSGTDVGCTASGTALWCYAPAVPCAVLAETCAVLRSGMVYYQERWRRTTKRLAGTLLPLSLTLYLRCSPLSATPSVLAYAGCSTDVGFAATRGLVLTQTMLLRGVCTDLSYAATRRLEEAFVTKPVNGQPEVTAVDVGYEPLPLLLKLDGD